MSSLNIFEDFFSHCITDYIQTNANDKPVNIREKIELKDWLATHRVFVTLDKKADATAKITSISYSYVFPVLDTSVCRANIHYYGRTELVYDHVTANLRHLRSIWDYDWAICFLYSPKFVDSAVVESCFVRCGITSEHYISEFHDFSVTLCLREVWRANYPKPMLAEQHKHKKYI